MIKFGNDIVTVGGDWLKIIPPPVKLAEYPFQQVTIPANSARQIFTDVPVTESDFAVVKVNYSEINGALVLGMSADTSDVTIDVATGSAQQIQFITSYLINVVAYDGTVRSRGGGCTITLSNLHFINRIIFDFNARKVHFYDINNVIVVSADMSSSSHWTPVAITLGNTSASNQTRCKVSGEIWQCYTMEQALSV